ncbi:hypothetical protein, unlikely [Trypanosoma brucei gambiense DAL972]|uniref:Uncharacterized protein n=1 Tax=Trypanosoma brucei gambiense (strain MHOM/CI/86/DAL972) TaxID=679716 RepID=C9ZIY6_TRYB9|nr:hypothetical protein, unlikely [Trypanosoma brucei gambiense DAL972]CBH09314.1 hypothetical protein, unlikely [Trypanosoma brucei gambiense DAL972]|eukprot:XP_011771622.1 hypothetical protein, unlikely [Trypanosoma brucei gambiense DAL972]
MRSLTFFFFKMGKKPNYSLQFQYFCFPLSARWDAMPKTCGSKVSRRGFWLGMRLEEVREPDLVRKDSHGIALNTAPSPTIEPPFTTCFFLFLHGCQGPCSA